MDVRVYRKEDKQAVAALWREVFPESPAHNVPEEDIERKMLVQPELFFVAEDDSGRIVGTAMGGFDGHRGWVYYVAVKEEYRKQGVGRKLMKAVERGLIDIGCTKLNLQVRSDDKDVIGFYTRLGYKIESRVSMARKLSDDNSDDDKPARW